MRPVRNGMAPGAKWSVRRSRASKEGPVPAPLEGVAPRAAVRVGGGAAAKAICASCQVHDHCLDLAVKAAGGLDQDHGVFGGTLPAERSRLRGNTFPEPSVQRQRRELAEQAHQLASPGRAAAGRPPARRPPRRPHRRLHPLGAAHARTAGGLAAQPLPCRPGRGRTRLRAAEQLGSVNAAATELGTAWPSLRKAFTRHGSACRRATLRRSDSGRSLRPASAAASRLPRLTMPCRGRHPITPNRASRSCARGRR